MYPGNGVNFTTSYILLDAADFATGCIHILEFVLELSRRGATSSVTINLHNFTPVQCQKPRDWRWRHDTEPCSTHLCTAVPAGQCLCVFRDEHRERALVEPPAGREYYLSQQWSHPGALSAMINVGRRYGRKQCHGFMETYSLVRIIYPTSPKMHFPWPVMLDASEIW